MRLNLYWRGFDVLDIEAHLFRRRRDDEDADEGPRLQAAGHLADSSRAEPMEPDTVAFGFGNVTGRDTYGASTVAVDTSSAADEAMPSTDEAPSDPLESQ